MSEHIIPCEESLYFCQNLYCPLNVCGLQSETETPVGFICINWVGSCSDIIYMWHQGASVCSAYFGHQEMIPAKKYWLQEYFTENLGQQLQKQAREGEGGRIKSKLPTSHTLHSRLPNLFLPSSLQLFNLIASILDCCVISSIFTACCIFRTPTLSFFTSCTPPSLSSQDPLVSYLTDQKVTY